MVKSINTIKSTIGHYYSVVYWILRSGHQCTIRTFCWPHIRSPKYMATIVILTPAYFKFMHLTMSTNVKTPYYQYHTLKPYNMFVYCVNCSNAVFSMHTFVVQVCNYSEYSNSRPHRFKSIKSWLPDSINHNLSEKVKSCAEPSHHDRHYFLVHRYSVQL